MRWDQGRFVTLWCGLCDKVWSHMCAGVAELCLVILVAWRDVWPLCGGLWLDLREENADHMSRLVVNQI